MLESFPRCGWYIVNKFWISSINFSQSKLSKLLTLSSFSSLLYQRASGITGDFKSQRPIRFFHSSPKVQRKSDDTRLVAIYCVCTLSPGICLKRGNLRRREPVFARPETLLSGNLPSVIIYTYTRRIYVCHRGKGLRALRIIYGKPFIIVHDFTPACVPYCLLQTYVPVEHNYEFLTWGSKIEENRKIAMRICNNLYSEIFISILYFSSLAIKVRQLARVFFLYA